MVSGVQCALGRVCARAHVGARSVESAEDRGERGACTSGESDGTVEAARGGRAASERGCRPSLRPEVEHPRVVDAPRCGAPTEEQHVLALLLLPLLLLLAAGREEAAGVRGACGWRGGRRLYTARAPRQVCEPRCAAQHGMGEPLPACRSYATATCPRPTHTRRRTSPCRRMGRAAHRHRHRLPALYHPRPRRRARLLLHPPRPRPRPHRSAASRRTRQSTGGAHPQTRLRALPQPSVYPGQWGTRRWRTPATMRASPSRAPERAARRPRGSPSRGTSRQRPVDQRLPRKRRCAHCEAGLHALQGCTAASPRRLEAPKRRCAPDQCPRRQCRALRTQPVHYCRPWRRRRRRPPLRWGRHRAGCRR